MDFSILQVAVFGALDRLHRVSGDAVSRVFRSAFLIVAGAREASHTLVEAAFSLVRSVLRAAERVTAAALSLAFDVLHAAIAAVIGQPEPAVDVIAQGETTDAQV